MTTAAAATMTMMMMGRRTRRRGRGRRPSLIWRTGISSGFRIYTGLNIFQRNVTSTQTVRVNLTSQDGLASYSLSLIMYSTNPTDSSTRVPQSSRSVCWLNPCSSPRSGMDRTTSPSAVRGNLACRTRSLAEEISEVSMVYVFQAITPDRDTEVDENRD